MNGGEAVARAQAIYAVLKPQARERYAAGHFYAMAGGKIVADDEAKEGIHQQVRDLNVSNDRVMIEQVHDDVVECNLFLGWITFSAMAGHLLRVMTPDRHPEQ